jgi:hypothetical protein
MYCFVLALARLNSNVMPLKNLFISALLLLPTAAVGQGQSIGSFRLSDRNRNQTATLIVKTKPFSRSTHRITFASPEYLKKHDIQITPLREVRIVSAIDGRQEWLGTDGEIPRVEIASMVVSFRGKRMAVPQELYSDCFEPSFLKNNFIAKLNDVGDTLFVFMAGSDGAGGYQVMWVLRKDGHHSRFVHNCSDCDYKDILLFLQKR